VREDEFEEPLESAPAAAGGALLHLDWPDYAFGAVVVVIPIGISRIMPSAGLCRAW
jgi:hypothetical protein